MAVAEDSSPEPLPERIAPMFAVSYREPGSWRLESRNLREHHRHLAGDPGDRA